MHIPSIILCFHPTSVTTRQYVLKLALLTLLGTILHPIPTFGVNVHAHGLCSGKVSRYDPCPYVSIVACPIPHRGSSNLVQSLCRTTFVLL
jgi:hypothetical protein